MTTNGTNRSQVGIIGQRIFFKELSYEIINAAIKVHNALGPGFTEKIYEEALCIELQNKRLSFERQKMIDVSYENSKIGEYFLDLVVEGKILVELKAVAEHHSLFEAQVYSYLKATKLKLGLLINFGTQRLTSKRIVN